jgi:hypothetical protein
MLAAALIASFAQAQPDRTGEPALMEVLAATGKLQNSRINIMMGSRAKEVDAFEMDYVLQLDLGKPGQFRAVGTGTWGESVLIVRNGPVLLEDPLTDGRLPILRDAPTDVLGAAQDLSLRGDFGSPFLLMLQGPAALNKLVASDSSITASDGTIRWKSKDYSNVRMTVDPGTKLPTMIEFDNLDYLTQRFNAAPNFRTKPESPMTRHRIFIEPLPKSEMNAFVVLRKDAVYNDQRKKKPEIGKLESRSGL